MKFCTKDKGDYNCEHVLNGGHDHIFSQSLILQKNCNQMLLMCPHAFVVRWGDRDLKYFDVMVRIAIALWP